MRCSGPPAHTRAPSNSQSRQSGEARPGGNGQPLYHRCRSKVYPPLAPVDCANCRTRHTVLASQLCLAHTGDKRLSNSYYRTVGQLGHAMMLAPPGGVSAFCVHVAVVVRGASKKQVIWPDAQAHVAAMANHQSFENRPMFQRKRVPVGSNESVVDTELAIPVDGLRTAPKPAPVPFVYLRPERLGRVWRRHCVISSLNNAWCAWV